ncbi:serine/threonine-protein kinase [Streptomyces roseicoloratus]|uniref:serine/threonine-protein kinase n=1 Tax=Streptomyces roseicoloratus TaxID=2508722 RepID=UPI0035A68431
MIGRLGRGGMGVVWRAVDEVLGREVAVKELRTYNDASGTELDGLRLRTQREARAAARVRHPGVVAVHDVTDHEGRPVIVMEFVDGPSLDGVLGERGTMEPREAAAVGAAVLDALAAAHEAGVLHRDVKPGNILLDRGGRVVLTDFGIAAMEDPGDGSATHLTRSGEIVGSLDYLAPERAQGQEPGPASDVWALGATLYAAVEGASPFRRTSTWSTLNAIVVEPLPEPRRAGPLAPALRLLMHKDPARRPDARTAADLLRAVAEGREARLPGAGPEAPGTGRRRGRGRRPDTVRRRTRPALTPETRTTPPPVRRLPAPRTCGCRPSRTPYRTARRASARRCRRTRGSAGPPRRARSAPGPWRTAPRTRTAPGPRSRVRCRDRCRRAVRRSVVRGPPRSRPSHRAPAVGPARAGGAVRAGGSGRRCSPPRRRPPSCWSAAE